MARQRCVFSQLNGSHQSHVLEALDSSGRLVQRRTVELATGEDFYWTLDSC